MAAAIRAARNHFDVIVVDVHPSYSALNLAIFDESDRILVPAPRTGLRMPIRA